MNEGKTVVLYHDSCPDGFGGAFAAWKKFGDTAEYRAVRHQLPPPEGLAGAHLYLIDFCYTREEMVELVKNAASLVVLDHHEGVEDVVEAQPAYVYDATRSGATIAWSYFHPDEPVPEFLRIIMKGDLYQPFTDEERALASFIYAQPYTFTGWDQLRLDIENPETKKEIMQRGRAYNEHFQMLVAQIASKAVHATFEGHTVAVVSGPRMFATELGTVLRKRGAEFVLITRNEPNGNMSVSMRGGDTKINLAKIAEKYGGNGHPGSAAFAIPWGAPIPWTLNENPRN